MCALCGVYLRSATSGRVQRSIVFTSEGEGWGGPGGCQEENLHVSPLHSRAEALFVF